MTLKVLFFSFLVCRLSWAHRAPIQVHSQSSLLQTWSKALDGTNATDTPITRVVNLLKEMQSTLKKEMDEDEELYEKLACWCNNNKYEKNQAIEAAEAKIAELESMIESLTAKTAELKSTIKETQDELEADKNELAEATALRNKQLKEFHGEELDGIQNIENLKAAIIVLGKHHGGAFPQFSMSLLGMGSHSKKGSPLDRQLDEFMRKNDFDVDEASVKVRSATTDRAVQKFLQEQPDAVGKVAVHSSTQVWSEKDKFVVERAVRSASLFLQAHGRAAYYPSYAAQSGEILGIMKQLKEEMEADLGDAQKTEMARAAAFAELKQAKTEEIAAGEKLLEEKKEELAQTDFDLANAKEDLERVKAALAEDQKFLMNLQKTCAEADKNFELRKKTRLQEIQAVSETITILTADEARDTFNGAYSFLQLSSRVRRVDGKRAAAAKALRAFAKKNKSPL